MSNLPQRLRDSVPKMHGVASAQCNDIEAVWQAADEIERLERELADEKAISDSMSESQ